MPNFTKGKTFTSTEELTNTKLHQLVEDASMNVTAITSLTALTDAVADTDTLPIADDSATAIRKVAASNFLKKNASAIFDAGTTKITGVATPTVGSDAATKTYADTKVAKTGDTMSGVLDMGSSKITNLGAPTASGDATTKAYVDSIAVVAGNLPNVTSSDNGSLLKVTSGSWTTTASDAVGTAQIVNESVTGVKLENSGATAGTYGGSTSIPQITVDAKGRITSAISLNAQPSDLSPSPAGTYGSGAAVPVITLNAKGQVTSVTTAVASSGASGGMFFENDITLNTSYTINNNKNAMTAGGITLADGVTVTVPSGSTWTIV